MPIDAPRLNEIMDSLSWTVVFGLVNYIVVSPFMMMLAPVFVTGQEISSDGFEHKLPNAAPCKNVCLLSDSTEKQLRVF